MQGPDRYSSVKEKIKAALKAQGLTYSELGERLGLSESGVKKLFKAKDISLGRLEQLSSALQLPLSELLDLSDGPAIKMVELDKKADVYFTKNKDCFEFYFLLVTEPKGLETLLTEYGYSKKRAYGYLRELDRLGFIRWLPGDQIVANVQGPWLFHVKNPFVRKMVGQWSHELIEDTILARHPNERDYFTQRIFYLRPESAAELQREISDLLLEFTRRSQREKKQHRERVNPIRVLGIVAQGQFVKKQKA